MSKESNLQLVVPGLLLGIFMSAMDNTIVATAMGTIVADLGGLDKFVWVTSAYMVAVMAGMPIFGKLSDMYGRKRFFIFGLIVFLAGSILCGTAQNIVQLSFFRALQGIGGGALMPVAFAIVFDIFPVGQRGKMTGLLGAVFGTASICGPLLGAYITDHISWHWIFYVNVPIGLISLLLITFSYHEMGARTKQKIDWGGAITLVLAVVSLMFALELGGKRYPWDSLPIIGLFTAFAICFLVFLYVETKAKEPIISFWLFKRRLFATSQILAFLYGGTFVILTVYIPIFVQVVYGGSATNAGIILTPMMLGSVMGSAISGIFQTKTSFRNLMGISVVLFFSGMYLLSTLTADTARWLLTLFMTVAGFGVGFSFSLLPTSSIHGLESQYRGTANATNSFFRSLGMTIGITVFGAIQTNLLAEKLTTGNFPDITNNPQAIFQANERMKIPVDVLDKIVDAFVFSITHIYTLAMIPIAIAAIFIVFMGDTRIQLKKEKVAVDK